MRHDLDEAVIDPVRVNLEPVDQPPPSVQGTPPTHRARVAQRVPRVAIVHDWLVAFAGAEKVLEQIVMCFPDADLFSVVDFMEERAWMRGKTVTTSFIQKLPQAKKRYRSYLPLMPLAIEQLDVSGYDLVISSSHAVAKGVLTGPDQIHVSYVHSPIRYAWDLQHQYLQQSNLTAGVKSLLARLVLHYMRNWDIRTSNSVDHFIANSAFIARRINKVVLNLRSTGPLRKGAPARAPTPGGHATGLAGSNGCLSQGWVKSGAPGNEGIEDVPAAGFSCFAFTRAERSRAIARKLSPGVT